MPIQFVCRKCRKVHAKKEYEESKFCKSCGSFLIPMFTVSSSKTMEPKANNIQDRAALMRAAESLRQRASARREYEILAKGAEGTAESKRFSAENWIWNSDFEKAERLKEELMQKCKGKKLEDVIPGKAVSNEQGQCYSISEKCSSKFKTMNYEESKRLIISDLKAIPGIGPAKEKALKRRGYATIEDLEKHPVWKESAKKFMKLIEDKKVGATQDWLGKRFPKSNPLLHCLAGFCDVEDFAIIDIETLGLSERPIILLGIAKPSKGHAIASQFLLRDIEEEPAAIWALISQLEPKTSLITFNGRGFDVPYIKGRIAYYGLDAPLDNPHFDLLHFTRRAYRNKLPDCKLETVEKYMGIKRNVNIPGALVPQFYDAYQRTRNVGPLVAIVEHNRQDLLTLGDLFSKLYEEWSL